MKKGTNRVVATATRIPQNIYMLYKVNQIKYYMGREDESWLWHRILGHINFDNLVKINWKVGLSEKCNKLQN